MWDWRVPSARRLGLGALAAWHLPTCDFEPHHHQSPLQYLVQITRLPASQHKRPMLFHYEASVARINGTKLDHLNRLRVFLSVQSTE